MLGYDLQGVITATVGANALLSQAFDVRGWNHVAFEVPTFSVYCVSATANVYVQGASTIDGTYRRIMDVGEYSAGAGIADWEVPEGIGNKLVICRPATRFNYLKVEVSKTATASMDIPVIRHM
jgi:hypothetical protein